MRTLNPREKRTIRLGGIAVAIYLAAFYGFKGWKVLDQKRAQYRQLAQQAQDLKTKIEPYQSKVLVVDKLMKDFQMDPADLPRASVVADASAAIQEAATSGGFQVGPVRESPARGSSRELASVQIEGTGPIPAAMSLLQRLGNLGYPLVVDSVQLTPESSRPGQIKMNLTVVILDFDQWKKKEAPHA